ncbi:MAG: hsp70 family protein [Desulfobacteraceae bacterium]|nr:hsp70 family protein [Desulfobacteraceae bacterium]MBC2756497.1 hsp70 family protein [Desulfobacteraceae bacterium]
MDLENKKNIIGIDLGTTNSAVSYVDLTNDALKNRGIKLFKVPQLTGAGEISPLPVLPSFCYIPGKYDITEDSIRLPWVSDEINFVGKFARDHGAKVPSRLVLSAKSWLCHSNADRRAKILPWGSGEDVYKISPVQATASYLKHIRMSWNSTKGDDDDFYLENQMIIITVPASFDEVARDLTIEASKLAGLRNVTLLEEPLAAFYSWLIRHEQNWQDFIKPGELVLVCDVGGGTSDFTLITLRETEGTPRFERIAVGDHLILGGDNIDLALARYVEKQFKQSNQLSSDRWKTLCHLCRQAKENILNEGKESETITMMGEGSSLIGGTLTARLKRSKLEEIVLDGFFPVIENHDPMAKKIQKGISEFGLPYETEPAITRHIGIFLEKHKADVKKILDKKPFPDLILFNGGSLKSQLIQKRIQDSVQRWFDEAGSRRPSILENSVPDLAVALGAAYYGLVKTGKGVRVGSGSARSYYLGFERKNGTAQVKKSAVCLVERGLDEGSQISLPDKKFQVLANQPVSFDLYSSTYRSGDRSGDEILIDDTLTPLPPLQTVIQFGQKGIKKEIPIQVEAEFSEMGVLFLWCRSLSTSHRWRLQFQLRDTAGKPEVQDYEVFDSAIIDSAVSDIRLSFSPNFESATLIQLMKTISKTVGRAKEKWPLALIRRLGDELLDGIDARKFSAEHEIRWLNLAGYCLRPGFGDGMDDQRIQALWKIYTQGIHYKKNLQVNNEWWILWRRVAAGLTPGKQRQFIQDLRALLMPKKGTKVRISNQERIEIWMAVANMERLTVKDKIEYGRLLLSELHPKKSRPPLLWAISRIGARELLYGPIDRVVPPKEVESWITHILEKEWTNPKPVGAALAQMARKTGDRMRDSDPMIMDQVIQWLRKEDLKTEINFLTSVKPMETVEESTIFGESLPSGIVLHET